VFLCLALTGCLDVPPPPADGVDVADARSDDAAGDTPDLSRDMGQDDGRDVGTDPEPDADVELDVPGGDTPDARDAPDVCEPSCFGRVCGDDGCGGDCGPCGDGAACEDGICQVLARPWEDVLSEREGYGAETTGGKDAAICVVTSAADGTSDGTLRFCAARPGGWWVRFSLPGGTVLRPATPVAVGSDTTVDGRGSDVVIAGRGISVRNVENVILLDLRVTDGDRVDENDGITVQAATNVWVHHCTVRDWTDGAVDVSRGARNITVSWSRLAVAGSSGSLAGDPGEEFNDGAMRMTYHHNWFDGLDGGSPRVREAWVHVVNNLYTDWIDGAIVVTHDGRALVQANYFDPEQSGARAVDYQLGDHPNGKTRTQDNESSRSIVLRENGTVPAPPYDFPVERAGSGLADRIRQGAGRRALPFPEL
jgi:pectate lyase